MKRTCGRRTYERSLIDILKLQSEVARAIAREIRVKLTAGRAGARRERAVHHRPTRPI